MKDFYSHHQEAVGDIERKVEFYLSAHRIESALNVVKTALSTMPRLANLHNLLGLIYHQDSRFAEALKCFDQALSINPDYTEAGLNKMATLCDLSRYNVAREEFAKLEQKEQKHHPKLVLGRLANKHVELGGYYQECQMLAEAADEYRKALNLYPEMPDVMLKLSKLYISSGQYDRAVQVLEGLLEKFPHYHDAYIWLGNVYYQTKRKSDAYDQWKKAHFYQPKDITVKAYKYYLDESIFSPA